MEKHLKEIANELKLIRLELEEMNGVEIFKDGTKVNLKALERSFAAKARSKGTSI